MGKLKKTHVFPKEFVEIPKKWTMPVRDCSLAYSQFVILFDDIFVVERLLWKLSPNPEVYPPEEYPVRTAKVATFLLLFTVFSAAYVEALISVASFGCIFSFSVLLVLNTFTQLFFRNHSFAALFRF